MKRDAGKMKDKKIDTVENLKNIVINGADSVKASASRTAYKVSNVIKTTQDKADVITKEFRDGSKEVKKDVAEAAGNIAKKFEDDKK